MSFNLFEKKTGVVFDDRMVEHDCPWDPDNIEKPVRYTASLKKCKDYGLIERCTVIPSRFATEEELLLVHDKGYIDEIKRSKDIKEDSDLETLASRYDSVYFNNKTYDSALLAAGSTLQLIAAVLNGSIDNGMAIVRPPGHHALSTDACGFCYFNNVAIAAKYALNNFNLSRILIIDWDVHHGQATQRTFYDDPRVLYFSIHRYQNGTFWPHLRESNFDFVGGDLAKGFNINVPLNGTGQGNSEYLAIFHNILLPIAYEFSPELVLISAGYDAAIGCPEGEMRVFPQAYAHFINALSCLALGRICVVLEGGYRISSLSEAVALTLRSLIGAPCPLIDACITINQMAVDTILNVLSVQRENWDSVKLQQIYTENKEYLVEKHSVYIEYTGNPFEGALKFPTRDYNSVVLPHVAALLESEIKDIISKTDLSIPSKQTCFVTSPKHKHTNSENIEALNQNFQSSLKALTELCNSNIIDKCTWLQLNEAHGNNLVSFLDHAMKSKMKMSFQLCNEISTQMEQRFPPNVCQKTSDNLLALVDAVMNKTCINGFCLTYSPENQVNQEDKSQFCTFNAIAYAAYYLIKNYSINRVLVIDWSTDHNNNIQKIFYDDDKVLSISLHYCGRKNCPMLIEECGINTGKGYNVNIPFTNAVTDGDYLAALFHVILPIAYEFCPEFVLISSSFNNETFSLLTPLCYGIIVKHLSALCNGKLVIDVEGWNHDGTFQEAFSCISSLVGSQQFHLSPGVLKPCPEAIEVIQNVVKLHRRYWKSLAFYKALPSGIPTEVTMIQNNGRPRVSSDPVAIPRRQDEPGTSKMDEWIGDAAGFDSAVELFCVTPLEYCPHLELLQPIPAEGLNPFARCYSCNDPNENWLCLHCYQVYCGRFINQHMLQHGNDMGHFLTLSYSDLSVWCYACDAYIHNEHLVPIKQHAHDKKFYEP